MKTTPHFVLATAILVACGSEEPEPSVFPGEEGFAEPADTCGDSGECLEARTNALVLDQRAPGVISVQPAGPGRLDVRLRNDSPLRDRVVVGAPVFRPRLAMGDSPVVATIRSVSQIEGGFRLETERATLFDVFSKGRIRRRYEVDFVRAMNGLQPMGAARRMDVNGPLPQPGARQEALTIGGDCEADRVDPIYSSGGVSLSVDPCRFAMTVTVDYDIEWGGVLPDRAHVVLVGDLDVALGLDLTMSGEFNDSQERSLASVDVPVGSLPLDITFDLAAGWILSGSNSAEAQVGFEMNPSLEVGFEWVRGDGASGIFDYDRSSSIIGPTINIGSDLYAEAYLSPRIGIEALEVLEVYAGLRGYGALNAETQRAGTTRNLCYDFSIGVVPEIGAAVDIRVKRWDFGPWTLDRWNYSKTLTSDCVEVSGRGNSTCVAGVDECVTAADCTGLSRYTDNRACQTAVCNRDCECELFDLDEWLSQFGDHCCGRDSDCDTDCGRRSEATCVDNRCTCSENTVVGAADVGFTVRAECANDSDCDDGLSYTSDTCDSGECVHNWSGVAGSSVTQSEYELLSECSRDSDCDDGNLSTQDNCAGGVCEHEGTAVRDACETISCSDGNPFTEDSCSNGTCSHATMVIR